MKNFVTHFITALALIFVWGQTQAQCPTGSVYLTSQQEVNDFAVNYPNCTTLQYLEIFGSSVIDLTPLNNLTSITNSLYIHDTSLIDLTGLNNLTSLGEDLRLHSNLSLTSLAGLENLSSIAGAIDLAYNYQLTSLSVLSNINTLGALGLTENDILTSLSGLEGITFISFIFIHGNDLLTDIAALQNVDPVTMQMLDIRDNSNLMVCHLPNFCTYLSYNPATHPRNILMNAGDCEDEAAVLAACALGVYDIGLSDVNIYPNPVKDILYLEKEVARITVTDLIGKMIIIKDNVSQLDMSGFENGIYFVTMEQKKSIKETKKVVKE